MTKQTPASITIRSLTPEHQHHIATIINTKQNIAKHRAILKNKRHSNIKVVTA